jgi:hypothetical protein
MTDQQISQQGLDARLVLDNEAYKQAMTALRAQVVDQWKSCPIRDQEGQLLLLQLAKLADKFEGILAGMVEAGKFAHHKIALDDARNESGTRKLMRRVL